MPFSSPLRWPATRPRTPFPEQSNFRQGVHYEDRKSLTFAVGRDRLYEQLERLGAADVDISTNLKLTVRGEVDSKAPKPSDRGVAVYFSLNGKPIEIACDKWSEIADNMAAIAKHIDALRGQERWGCGDIKTAFSGHMALPNFSARKHWTEALKVRRGASEADVQAAWRALIRDAVTEADQMDINIARDEALAEIRSR